MILELDFDKGLYFGSKLDIEQKNYLHNHGYEKDMFVPIGKPRQEECWVKKNKVESLSHTFLVHNIGQALRKITKEIEINITEKPDIIFKHKGKEYAIEVETGNGFKKHKNRLAEKFYEARLKYKKNIFIVLTNSDVKV